MQNFMGNRLACLLVLQFLWVSSAVSAQSTTESYGSAGQDNGCSSAAAANDPACQQNSNESNSNMRGRGSQSIPSTGSLPSNMQENQGVYVDSAGQVHQVYPRQNAGQYFPGNLNPDLQPPDPITDFQRMVSLATGQTVPIYGRQLFRGVPSTFAPVDQTPVTPDYVIGPGDEILVRVWGPVVFNDRLTVDRSGSIYIPKVGSIHVSGIPFSELDKHLRTEMGRVFRNFDLNVNMGQLRSIQVFVLGQAKRPGSYTLSSLSTLVNALFASGGPSVQGSMRSIQLKRDGKLISDLDLYALLNKGDKSQDAKLLPGDVIFIPPVGSQVAMVGAVRIPAIYEIKSGTTLEDVLSLAGGLSSVASDAHVALERIEEHNSREAMQISLDAAGKSTQLRDGDVLRVFSISPRFEKTVTVRGNLANPGRFAWHAGIKLSDVIPDRESLLTNNYWRNHNRLGLPSRMFFEPLPRMTGTMSSSNQQGLPQSNANSGQSQFGTAPQNQESAQVQSVLEPRYDQPDNTQVPTPENVNQRNGLAAEQEGSRGSLASQQNRIVTGSAAVATDNIQVRMPAPEIDWSYAVIERLDPVTLRNSLLPFNLGALVLDHDASQNLELQAGDVVTIFSQGDIRVPLNQQTKFVKLEGEIASGGTYSVRPGETLRQLVTRAGGLAPNAYLFGSEFTRESARVLQQQRLDEYVDSLAIDVQRQGTNKIASAISSQDATATTAVLSGQREMIARLRQIRATGRIVIEINPDATGLDTIPDLALEDGDTFVVPTKPATINVVGAVYDQNSFLFAPSRSIGEYLHLAGGPNRDADSKHAFLIRADGSVLSRETANTFWGNTFEKAVVNPGDTIVVPEKLFKPSALKGFLEWSQVFSQLALGAASIAVLAQ
jgi:protein involved in polysaccharide export with SLBB domain